MTIICTAVTLPLKEFINELDEMAAKWDLFGSALGVPMKVLERIQDSNGLERYMKAMLEVWLNTGKATLEQLKKALIEVDNVRLAENIQQKLMEGKVIIIITLSLLYIIRGNGHRF